MSDRSPKLPCQLKIQFLAVKMAGTLQCRQIPRFAHDCLYLDATECFRASAFVNSRRRSGDTNRIRDMAHTTHPEREDGEAV